MLGSTSRSLSIATIPSSGPSRPCRGSAPESSAPAAPLAWSPIPPARRAAGSTAGGHLTQDPRSDVVADAAAATRDRLQTGNLVLPYGNPFAVACSIDKATSIELLFVIGNDGMLSWISNAIGIQPETDATAAGAMDDSARGRIKT